MNDIQFFLDFDGTVTKSDVVDMILERFASNEWKTVEQEWVSGKIGSRECLTRQLALVSATKEQLMRLVTEVEVDPHFASFLKTAKKFHIPVTIVSDGFQIVIEEVLRRVFNDNPGFSMALPVFSNNLEWQHSSIKVKFPSGAVCEHHCANCKSRVIRTHRKPAEKIIFVGDGLSDRFAASASDLTFAKGKLLKFCEEKNINHKKYSSFKDIEEWLLKHHYDAAPKTELKHYLVERN